MKKVICLLISLVLLLSLVPTAFAAEKTEFVYETLTDSTIRITDVNDVTEKLVIPSKIDGYTVTEFDVNFSYKENRKLESIEFADTITKIDNNFMYCHKLKSVRLPNAMKIIPAKLFYYCTRLENVTFPEKLRKIGAQAFYCASLTDVKLPDTLTYIGKKAFHYCNIESLTLPKNLTRINADAFKNCGTVETLIIPDSVRTIERSAFSKINAKTVEIGKGTKTIKPKAFMKNTELAEFIVDENNPYYCAVDGVLFTKDMKTLVCYPQHKNAGGSYTIPDSVEKILGCAFAYSELNKVTLGANVKDAANKSFKHSERLETITLNDSLGRIGKEAFCGCYKLTAIDIPEGVTKVKSGAFKNCEKLAQVKLPQALTTIEESSFENCYALEALDIPASVKNIEKWAFFYSGIKELTIPNFPDYGYKGSLSSMYKLVKLTLLNPDADYTRFFSWGYTRNLESIVLGDKNIELNVGDSADVDSFIYMMSGDKSFELEGDGVVSIDTSSDDHVTVTALASGEATVTMTCGIVSQKAVITVEN